MQAVNLRIVNQKDKSSVLANAGSLVKMAKYSSAMKKAAYANGTQKIVQTAQDHATTNAGMIVNKERPSSATIN